MKYLKYLNEVKELKDNDDFIEWSMSKKTISCTIEDNGGKIAELKNGKISIFGKHKSDGLPQKVFIKGNSFFIDIGYWHINKINKINNKWYIYTDSYHNYILE